MQDRKIEVFNEEDKTMVDRLRLIGMSRKAAYVFAYLLQRDGSARDIEITTGLRQPEVSLGTKELSTYLTITKVPTKKSCIHPTYIYSLATPWADVIQHYYRASCGRWDKVTAAYDKLVTECLDLNSQKRLDQK